MKTAIISGIQGQDGAYLARFLLDKGYKVIGAERRSASGTPWRLDKLNIRKELILEEFELLEFSTMVNLIKKYSPDEFYNLAAQSFVKASFDIPIITGNSTGLGVTRILEAIRLVKPDIKFYQASSSEMFGKVTESQQNENTPFYPRSPYAVSKVFGHFMTINYREAYNMFCCSGILFNHESPLRGLEFVTRKISSTMAKIKLKQEKVLELGNLNAKRDWGFAGDYVEAMHMMLNQQSAEDYVICTGENHSVKEFITKTAEVLDIDIAWEGQGKKTVGIDKITNNVIVKVNERFYRPSEVDVLKGDYQKAKTKMGWVPKCSFAALVEMMAEADLKDLNY